MRWLIAGTFPPEVTTALVAALVRHEHTATTLAEAGIAPDATPFDILAAAHQKQLEVLTDRADLMGAPFEQSIRFIRTLVYLQLKGGPVELDDALDRIFARYKRLATGRLYTVTETRVKVRQLPGH